MHDSFLRAKAYPSMLQAARFGRETKASKQVLLSQEANAFVMCRFTPITLPGKDQACLGTSGSFHAYTHQEISSLELCRVRCVETPGCTAVDFGALGCRVWTEDVIQTEDRKGSTCLRYGSMFSNASAFKPVNGGMDRACRGMNASDNSDSYYDLLWSWPENSSISACQDRCASALGCFYMLLPCVVCMLKHAEAAF